MNRRAMLLLSLGLCLPPLARAWTGSALAQRAIENWHIPAESGRHKGCWMAWPARTQVWGKDLAAVRRVCARVARAIVQFEPVTMLARPEHVAQAAHACGPHVEVVSLAVDDCWLRDTGPLFAVGDRGIAAGSLLNFNGWGNKQRHDDDSKVALRLCQMLGFRHHALPLVSEGGAWDFDGEGTALTTESALLNPNRNPALSKTDVETAARKWFGVEKIIWLPGARDYWTDGHIDGIARFVRPGVVIIESASDPADPDAADLRRDQEILRSARDARGRSLHVVTMERPRHVRINSPDFCNCYVNFYIANGAVVMARFGDTVHDERARRTVASLFPERRVVQVDIDALAAGGGGIHCITLQQPA